MALKSPYLAAENSAMDRRSKALHRFLVASLVLLLVAVGLVGHQKKQPHAGAAGSAAYDQRVLAYRERVDSAQKLLRITNNGPDRIPLIQAEADKWVAGYKSGELKPLTPAAYEDHLRDGVRGEVLRFGLGLASQMSVSANAAFQAGNFSVAADDATIAAETAWGMRDFEIQAHLQSLLVGRRALTMVLQCWPKLPVEQREKLRTRIAALKIDPQETSKMAELEAAQVRDYAKRQQIAVSMLDQSSKFESIATDREQEAAQRGSIGVNDRIQSILSQP